MWPPTWTECLPLLHRTQHGVVHALQGARGMFPFPLLGIDTDNGGEFINDELMAYCGVEQLTFTRGRVASKNDQSYVEQRNGSVVRQLVGYDRFEGQRAYRQLAELYRAVRLYVNFFQPLDETARLYRSRKDLFEAVWAEVGQWLTAQPERNGRSIFTELQERYSGQFANGQIRTLQRHIAIWRAKTMLAFDDGWTDDVERVAAQSLPRPLRLAREPDSAVEYSAPAWIASPFTVRLLHALRLAA